METKAGVESLKWRQSSTTTERNSVLQLSELGEAVSSDIGAQDWAVGLLLDMEVRDVDEFVDMQPYDVQAKCFDYVGKLDMPVDRLNVVKTCAYKNGIDIQQVLDVLALEMRNVLMPTDK